MTLPAFSTNLLNLLAERGWSQRELGRRAGVSQPSIFRYCTGAARPKVDHLLALAGALGVGPEAIDPAMKAPNEKFSQLAAIWERVSDTDRRALTAVMDAILERHYSANGKR